MEYCDGGKVDDKQYMTQHGIDVNEVWTAVIEICEDC